VKQRPEAPHLEKPPQPGRVRAVVLAILVHAAFFAIIVFGVTWQSRPSPPVEAELWDKLPPAKTSEAPKPAEPPKPEPAKPEPPKPEPPKPEPPKPVKVEPPRPDPAIALKAEREKRERLERTKAEEKKKADDKKKVEEKKKADEKQRREDVERKKVEEAQRREQEAARIAEERRRAEQVAKQQSEIDKWVTGIRAKIRGRANVPDTVIGNPEVTVRIRVLPGGEVLDITITKRSGNPAYDTAIERGIRSASPLPVPPPDSELFPRFRELNLNFRHER
jgi:colicin import membrane protein